MERVKWLFAIFFALTFTLATEVTGAFAVMKGIDWYNTLLLPSFSISGKIHSAIWCIVYILEAIVISRLLVGNYLHPFMAEYLSIKLLSACWTVFFFSLKMPLFCLVIITVILTLNFSYMKNMFKLNSHPLKNAVFIPVLLWYAYLWILNYSVVLLN